MNEQEKLDYIQRWLKETCYIPFADWEWDPAEQSLSLYDNEDYLLEEYKWKDIYNEKTISI